MSLDYSTPWTQLGEVNLQGCGAVRCSDLVIDHISVAACMLVFNVLVGCSAKWLANVVDIITNPARKKKKSPHQLVEALTCGGSYCPGTSDLHKPSQMPLLKAYKNPVLELGKEKAKKKKIFIMCDSSR